MVCYAMDVVDMKHMHLKIAIVMYINKQVLFTFVIVKTKIDTFWELFNSDENEGLNDRNHIALLNNKQ